MPGVPGEGGQDARRLGTCVCVCLYTRTALSNSYVLTCTYMCVYGYLSVCLWVFVLVLDGPFPFWKERGQGSTPTFCSPMGTGLACDQEWRWVDSEAPGISLPHTLGFP